MISAYTASHNPKWLDECYASLDAQTHKDWEWVVILNNGAEWTPPDDIRVKAQRTSLPEGTKSVGAFKREAVSLCSGSILVELDHDDVLMPDALEEIASAFEDPGVCFAYSDFAQINEDGSPNFQQFDPAHGWTYRAEGDYLVCSGLEPSPHNVSLIWYAPNHVRAFRSDAYLSAGGYDESREVLDDQDLMCRLFLQGKFHHIKKNLYLQRVHPLNTQSKPDTNAFIQTETVRIGEQMLQPMLLKWSADNGLLALDLGGAHNPAPGYKTVDMHAPADFVGDIFEVLGGMEDGSVGVIRAVDFCEHITDKVRLWNEFYRVLAHGGMVLSLTPSSDGRGAYQDPTHVAFYNENSFWYWVDENYRKFVPEIKTNFQVSRLATYFPSDWHREHNIPYVNANLIAIKEGGRQGGRLGI